MSIKLILYCIFIPFSIWVITSTNLDKIFKKLKVDMNLEKIISLVLAYLLVNIFFDIYSTISLL